MTPQQLHHLERYVLRLQSRERIARVFGKAILICGSIALVLGWWWSLVSCTGLPEDFPEGPSMETWMHEENVLDFWPRDCSNLTRQGAGAASPLLTESEIPKLTEN